MSFFEQVSRAAKLGSLGWQMKRLRGSSEDQREEAAKAVASQMASLRGIPQKFGQIFHLKELGAESSAFAELSESSQSALPLAALKNSIHSSLGKAIDEIFSEFSEDGIAASLGQVHRARLKSGEEVAVKVQYPKVGEALEHDLKALGWLALPISNKAEGFSLDAYKRELRESLLFELDYKREAQTLSRFHERVREQGEFEVPRPFEELSNESLLVMTWLEGSSFSNSADWTNAERSLAGRYLLRFFLQSWLIWAEVHGDPHPGNFRLIESQGGYSLGIIDFGCVKQLSEAEQKALLFIITKGDSASAAELLSAFTLMGFEEQRLARMESKLPAVTKALLMPFFHQGPFSVEDWKLSKLIEEALGDERWNFRFAGPPAIIHFIRAFSGLIQYLKAYNLRINWKLELENVLEMIDLSELELEVTAPEVRKSRSLHVQVTEEGRTKVKLSFPSSTLRNLAGFMPEEVSEKLKERDISVQSLIDYAITHNFPQGDLFKLEEGEKNFRVWLE